MDWNDFQEISEICPIPLRIDFSPAFLGGQKQQQKLRCYVFTSCRTVLISAKRLPLITIFNSKKENRAIRVGLIMHNSNNIFTLCFVSIMELFGKLAEIPNTKRTILYIFSYSFCDEDFKFVNLDEMLLEEL